MDGDLGALPELCALAEEFGCIMMVDDAHASGVFGRNGRGTIDHFGMHGRVDIQVGTLSKAIGALGGYVAGIARADRVPVPPRAAVPVLDLASARGRGRVHRGARRARCEEPQIIERLWENTRFFKAGLQALGFNTGLSESPITPVIVGDGALAMKLSDRLFQEGVFAQGIAFPTVARDKARVRTIVTATHTRDELQFALDVFAKVGRELGDHLNVAGPLARRVAPAAGLLRHLHEGSHSRRPAAPVHARHARRVQVLHARHVDVAALARLPWHRRVIARSARCCSSRSR